MCEISKCHRKTFRDQDPPRIRERSTENLLKDAFQLSRSTPNSPTALQRALSLEKCFSDPEFFRKHRQQQLQMPREKEEEEKNSSVENTTVISGSRNRDSTSSSRENNACTEPEEVENCKELLFKVPLFCRSKNVSFHIFFLLSFSEKDSFYLGDKFSLEIHFSINENRNNLRRKKRSCQTFVLK